MKKVLLVLFIFCGSLSVYSQGQTDLQKLVETELAFAKTAAAKGTKAAFLEFLDDEGIIFQPNAVNGKLFWKNKEDSEARLLWSPSWADVSSDGVLGYTTGSWEYRPKGMNDHPASFGQYVTIWEKKSDGSFKAILDIGISHNKLSELLNEPEKEDSTTRGSAPISAAVSPAPSSKSWRTPTDTGSGDKNVRKKITLSDLTDLFGKQILSSSYFRYLADDAVVLREDFPPFYTKSAAYLGLEKSDHKFPPMSFLKFEAELAENYGNMTYTYGVYQLTHKDKSINKWNFMQIWKFRKGKWQIVLDIFSPIPEEKK